MPGDHRARPGRARRPDPVPQPPQDEEPHAFHVYAASSCPASETDPPTDWVNPRPIWPAHSSEWGLVMNKRHGIWRVLAGALAGPPAGAGGPGGGGLAGAERRP